MRMRNFRRRVVALTTLTLTAALMGACFGGDDCKTVAKQNVAAAMVAATVRPKPPVIVKPKVYTPPPTRATSTRTTTKRTTTHPVTPPTSTTVKPSTAAPAANPVALKPGKKVRALKGELAYYPTPIAKQHSTNVYLAQDAIRRQIETYGRFTKGTKHYSPVTKRTYIYRDDDSYKKDVPQDLYDPFDPRNWTHPFSPFNLSKLLIFGQPVSPGPNVLNGDYHDDEAHVPGREEPPADPSPSSANRC